MTSNICLFTPRLVLRPWRLADAEDLYSHASDPLVGPSAGWPAHTSIEESEATIETVLSGPFDFAIELRETCEVIGSISLKMPENSRLATGDAEAEIGFWVGVPFWGQGLTPEAAREVIRFAFDDLGLERLWCGAFSENIQSQRVQEKLGFQFDHRIDNYELPLLGTDKVLLASTLVKPQ